MLRELIKSLYAIANAIKGKSDGGNSVEENYIKFIQPVGIVHVTQSDPPATEIAGDISENVNRSIVIDEYRQMPVDDYGELITNVFLVYNRADVENGINNKFEYGYYITNNNLRIHVYFNYEEIRDPMPLNGLLSMFKPNESNPEFDEINVSSITESNLEDFVTVMIQFITSK